MTWDDSIDWGSVPAYIAALSFLVAAKGLSTWRRQMTGTHDFELARRTFKAVLQVRDAVQAARHPAMSVAEAKDWQEDSPQPWETYAYQARWDRVTEARQALSVEILEAEAVWADLLKDDMIALYRHTNRLYAVIRRYTRSLDPRPGRRQGQPITEQEDRILYEGYDDADVFTSEMNKIVTGFEEKLRKKLGR